MEVVSPVRLGERRAHRDPARLALLGSGERRAGAAARTLRRGGSRRSSTSSTSTRPTTLSSTGRRNRLALFLGRRGRGADRPRLRRWDRRRGARARPPSRRCPDGHPALLRHPRGARGSRHRPRLHPGEVTRGWRGDLADLRPDRRRPAHLAPALARTPGCSHSPSRSARSASGSRPSSTSTSERRGSSTRRPRSGSQDLGVSYKVGLYDFSLWLVGLTVGVGALAIAYGLRAGRERARAYFGLMLVLVGATVGVFAAQDLLLFYVFFEADADPALRPHRGLGRRELPGGDDQVRHLHDGRLAAHARLDRRARAVAGHVRPDADGDERKRRHVPRLRDRVRHQGAAVALPRLAARRLPRKLRRRSPRSSRGSSRRPRPTASSGSRYRSSPSPWQTMRDTILVLAAIGLVYGSLLAFRPPDFRGVIAYSSLAQMCLILIGLFAVNDSGVRRRAAPDDQPRPHLGRPVPARGLRRAPHRDRPVRAARRHGARDARSWRRS